MAFSTNRGNRVSVFVCFLSFVLSVFLNSARVSGQAFACDVVGNPALAGFPFCDKSLPINVRVADLVSRLTLKEKVGSMVDAAADVSRLGIPRYEWWSEALHGVSYIGPGTRFSNVVPGATSFPMPILTAASFNSSLFQAIGKVKFSQNSISIFVFNYGSLYQTIGNWAILSSFRICRLW